MYQHFISYRPEVQLASLTASLSTRFVHPTIDKLTLVADFRYYQKNIEQLSRHNDFLDIVPDYSMHYQKRLRTASDLFVQLACPVSSPVPNVRIEFNPNKMDTTGSLWHTLLPMLRNKRITRIDYAIDYNSDLSEWQFTTTKARKTHRYNSPNGKLETLYLGTPSSTDQYRIYDKALEQKQNPSSITGVPCTTDFHHWRIEQQFTLDKNTEFWMLRPFEGLIAWKPDTFTGDFIDDLVLTSLHTDHKNWARLSRRQYSTYRKLIKDATRVVHMPVKPVTTFKQGYPALEQFLKELLA